MKLQTLRKLLNLASSDNDQEALIALRQAQKLLGSHLGDGLLAGKKPLASTSQFLIEDLRDQAQHWEESYQREHARANQLYARYVRVEEELEHRKKEVFRLRRELDRLEERMGTEAEGE